MSRKIHGTRDNQIFEFNPVPVIRVFRATETQKPVAKRKRKIIYTPKNETKIFRKNNLIP